MSFGSRLVYKNSIINILKFSGQINYGNSDILWTITTYKTMRSS